VLGGGEIYEGKIGTKLDQFVHLELLNVVTLLQEGTTATEGSKAVVVVRSFDLQDF